MAKIVCLDEEEKKSKLVSFLQKAIQSAHINFLIGSGCSSDEVVSYFVDVVFVVQVFFQDMLGQESVFYVVKQDEVEYVYG